MCLLYFSVYRCCKLTELNDFLVVLYKLRIIGNSADGSAICCIIGGRHRAVLTERRNRDQLADNYGTDHPDFTVCNNIIRYMYRAELILGRSFTFRIRIPVNAHGHGFYQRANAHGHGFCPADVVTWPFRRWWRPVWLPVRSYRHGQYYWQF